MINIIKRVLIVIALIPVLSVLLIITPFFISPILNNITLSSFTRQIYKYPLPNGTELIEKKAVCGKLNGNGNGMDFFACILIKSDMSIDQLKQYYGGKKFKTAKSKRGHLIDVEIVLVNGYKFKTDYVEHKDIYFNKLKNISDNSGYYAVMIYDGGYSADFDIRGH